MSNYIQKDKKKRMLFAKYELKRLQYKYIINNFNISKDIRFDSVSKLNNLLKNTSKVRIKNRCILTGRGRSISRFCRLSRITLRNLSAKGAINGLIKSTW